MQPNLKPGSESQPAPLGPQAVPSHDDERRPTSKWVILLVFVAIAGAGYWLWQKQEQVEREAAAAKIGIRTATLQSGTVEKTIRLAGVTAAEKFVSLIAPQIRGSRSGRGRGGFSLQGMDSASVAALPALGGGGARSSVGSGGGAASGSAAAAGAGGSLASTGAASARTFGGSGATRAASSRVASSGGGTRGNSVASSGGGTSASVGSDGLGSTSRELGSGLGGPSGGGGDFTLVLQNLVKPGSIVKKGETVAEFDRQYMLQRLEDYKNTMETAKAQLAQQKANLELARYTHKQNIEKAKGALDKAKLDVKTLPVLSNIDAERVKLSLEEAEAQYKQQVAEGKFIDEQEKAQLKFAELEFKSLELEYKRSEQNAERMVAKANIDGMTVMQNTMRGSEFAQIQAGDQVYPGQFFMQVVDPNRMLINATVNQVDGEQLRLGMKARVRFDAYPGLEVPAHIVNIAAVPKSGGMRASFVREIPVMLKIDQMDTRIIPDLSCSIDIVMQEEKAETVAPLAGVFEDEQTGKRVVYIKQGEAWNRREVEVGLENNLVASVKGLSKGEVIALDKPPAATKG
ncbi:MAG: HlyD family efflux transporter periplasmic adaptor subunit [Acidobacteria bacterium]|nr:HlyD family efflux transporter periplasmic adaptor subunit [Acidobacteriota bacterium]